jgi:hypothetical protein
MPQMIRDVNDFPIVDSVSAFGYDDKRSSQVDGFGLHFRGRLAHSPTDCRPDRCINLVARVRM